MAEINTTQLRDALAWATNDPKRAEGTDINTLEWIWQAIQGDFNEDRSTGQIVLDAAVSMIPGVDQICDVRDLIANCNKLEKDIKDTWAWVALVLTLIGLFPVLGSLVKGVLKVFFHFVRRAGGNAVIKAVNDAMTWVITLLRRRAFQQYIAAHKIDEIFLWLAKEIRSVKNSVSTSRLLLAFDTAIKKLTGWTQKVSSIPVLSGRAQNTLNRVMNIRKTAKNEIEQARKNVDEIFDTIIARLELEAALKNAAIVDVTNVHFRGAMPEAAAIGLMRNSRTRPSWLSDGAAKFSEADEAAYSAIIAQQVALGWPKLSSQNIKSFHAFVHAEIKGPARLVRIIAPTSGGMGDCWVSEKIFKELNDSPDPRAAWRKFLAVWPDWNVNGQFVIYDIKAGETLKVWKGPASSQLKTSLPDSHLEGGWEQIIFSVDRSTGFSDTMQYFKVKSGHETWKEKGIDYAAFQKLTKVQKTSYTPLRVKINHPNISGPFETGWGYADFAGKGFSEKIGIPNFPGQMTVLKD